VPIVLIGVLHSGAQCGNCELNVWASLFAKQDSLCDKGVKDLGFFWRRLGRNAGGVEVRRSRSGNGVLWSNLDGEVVKHALTAVFHVDADLAVAAKIEVHCERMMEVSASLLQFAMVATCGVEPFRELIVHET